MDAPQREIQREPLRLSTISRIAGPSNGRAARIVLGFDVTVTSNAFGSPALGAVSPRFSIILSTGVTLFGSAIYCSGPTNALGTSIPFELGPAK